MELTLRHLYWLHCENTIEEKINLTVDQFDDLVASYFGIMDVTGQRIVEFDYLLPAKDVEVAKQDLMIVLIASIFGHYTEADFIREHITKDSILDEYQRQYNLNISIKDKLTAIREAIVNKKLMTYN